MAEYEKLQTESLEQESTQFYDPSMQWRMKEVGSYKEIVLRVLENCRVQWSKDMRKGGTYYTTTPRGVLPIYYPDQEEVCINATQTLYDFLLWHFDDEARNKVLKIKQEIDDLADKYYKEFEENKKGFGPKLWKKIEESIEKKMQHHMLNLYREMFRELILLFKRQNELSGRKKIGAY